MSQPAAQKHLCADCVHFKQAPYESKRDGCYHPKLMQAKQKDAFLDEQQLPGDHTVINRNGDCPEWQARPGRMTFLRRLFSLGA